MAPQRPQNLPDIHVPPNTSEKNSKAITNTPTSVSQQSIYTDLKSTLAIPNTTIPPKSPRQEHPARLTSDFYLDRENKYTAEMLSRFRTLVFLANTQEKSTPQDESGAAKEVAASEALRMEVESLALVC
jgi:hypothetical protein